MIKLKDLIKEEECHCGDSCCSTKESVNEEVVTERKVDIYFRDDLQNQPISRQAYSEVNGQMRHLEFGVKDLKKSIRKQNDRMTIDNIQYIVLKAFEMKKAIEKK
jgi:GrpB-like predicted nucleotidyltransferase (UPF0157 family)